MKLRRFPTTAIDAGAHKGLPYNAGAHNDPNGHFNSLTASSVCGRQECLPHPEIGLLCVTIHARRGRDAGRQVCLPHPDAGLFSYRYVETG